MDVTFGSTNRNKFVKTYSKRDQTAKIPVQDYEATISKVELPLPDIIKREPLTTRNAVKFLLEGGLKNKVCRYCLHVAPHLSELDLILQVADNGTVYKVSIKDMVASFHPFKVADDPNWPKKICGKCVDSTISSYLFTQQCERAERALRNCFDDVYEKFDKLDPLDTPKHKRGKRKLNPNFNILYAEYNKIIDYADPIIHIVNTTTETLTYQPDIQEFECLKCSEVLPNMMSLLNHSKTHPKSMWYNCRLCGKSFPKCHNLKKHMRVEHSSKDVQETTQMKEIVKYDCKRCGLVIEKYYEYLQHIEKHKFKMVLEHLVDKNMDELCAVCLNKEGNMVTLDKTITLHGGCPELTGDRHLYKMLASTLSEMNLLDYIGTKICKKCLDHAITSYVFINHAYFVRKRLSTCVSAMLDNLSKLSETKNNICVEISPNAIMNVVEPFEDSFKPEDDIDESKSNVEVLEDEFRLKSEDENDAESEKLKVNIKEASKYIGNSLVNGYKLQDSKLFVCKRNKVKIKFTCPICNKHFISDYFLKRHILKHKPKKVECNICNFQFKSKFELYEHKKMCHFMNKSLYLSCKICGRCYSNKKNIKCHVKHKKYQCCQLCDKTFKCEKYYIAHFHKHMRKLGVIMRKYSHNCGFCEKDCPNDNEFSLHVNKVHLKIKPYGCDMCEKYFYTEKNLKDHKKLHSVRSKEKCNFCDKILKSRKQLVIHIRKHIGDKPFSCQICCKSFYSEHKMGVHMIECHGGRFCCKFCKSTYCNKRRLIEHVKEAHNCLF